MKLLIVTLSLLLVGCGSNVDVDMMQRASHVCDNLGGTKGVVVSDWHITVYCNSSDDNRTRPSFNIDRRKS